MDPDPYIDFYCSSRCPRYQTGYVKEDGQPRDSEMFMVRVIDILS